MTGYRDLGSGDPKRKEIASRCLFPVYKACLLLWARMWLSMSGKPGLTRRKLKMVKPAYMRRFSLMCIGSPSVRPRWTTPTSRCTATSIDILLSLGPPFFLSQCCGQQLQTDRATWRHSHDRKEPGRPGAQEMANIVVA